MKIDNNSKKLILFDLTSIAPWKGTLVHGGGEYGRELFKLLVSKVADNDLNFDIEIIIYNDQQLSDDIKYFCQKHSIKEHKIEKSSEVIVLIKSNIVDIFYSPVPYYLADFYEELSGCKTTIIGTIHGTRVLELGWRSSGYFYRTDKFGKLKHFIKLFFKNSIADKSINKLKKLVQLFDGNILTVSEHTKSILGTVIPEMNWSKIIVSQIIPYNLKVNLLVKNKNQNNDNLKSELQKLELAEDEYFVLLGANRVEKNAKKVFDAVKKYWKNTTLPGKMAVVGMTKKQKEKLGKEITERKDILFLNYLDEKAYSAMMAGAKFLLYPSLTEGFGYPPLEFMSFGKPSIISGSTSLPLVYQKGIVFCNPESELEIAARINLLWNNSQVYQQLKYDATEEFSRIIDWLKVNQERSLDYILGLAEKRLFSRP